MKRRLIESLLAKGRRGRLVIFTHAARRTAGPSVTLGKGWQSVTTSNTANTQDNNNKAIMSFNGGKKIHAILRIV
jgi:hypothetical protein